MEKNTTEIIKDKEQLTSDFNRTFSTLRDDVVVYDQPEDSKTVDALEGVAKNADEAGWSLSGFGSNHDLGHGFEIGAIAFTAFNFLRLPFSYAVARIRAYVHGKPPPEWKLSHTARMIYTGISLGLGLTMLFVPGALPIITIVAAISSAAVSVIMLAKLYHDRYAFKATPEYKAVEEGIAEVEKIRGEAINIGQEFESYLEDEKNGFSKYPSRGGKYIIQMEMLEARYNRLNPPNLYSQKAYYDKKIQALEQSDSVLNRSVGVFLSSLGVIGAVTFFFVPPVGLGILGATAILGGVYALARGFVALRKWYTNRNKPVNLEKDETLLRTKEASPELKLEIEHSPDKMFQAVLHPSSTNQSVVSKLFVDVKKLLGLNWKRSDNNTTLTIKRIETSQNELKPLHLHAALPILHKVEQGNNKDERESEGEGEGEGGPHPH